MWTVRTEDFCVLILISPVQKSEDAQYQDLAVLYSRSSAYSSSENRSVRPQLEPVTSILEKEPWGLQTASTRAASFLPPWPDRPCWFLTRTASIWRNSCPGPAVGLNSDTIICFPMTFPPCFPNGVLPQALAQVPYLSILSPDGRMLVPPSLQLLPTSPYYSILK